MKKNKLMLVFLMVLLIANTAFAMGQKETAQENKSETIIFTDSCGRQVELPAKIDKVAPSGAAAQMIIYAARPDCIIGLSQKLADKAKKFFPDYYSELPIFGQFYGKNVSLNFESLIGANPQVIIDMGDKKATHKADMDMLQEQTGIPVIFIEANLKTFPEAYRTLGKLLGVEEYCEKLATYIENTVELATNNAKQITEKKSVYFGTGKSGLDANAKGSIHADVIEIIGAENAAVVENVSNKGGGNPINIEQLIIFNPDAIILASDGPYDSLKNDTLWNQIEAVKNNKYYSIPDSPFNWMANPPSVNRIIGIKWLQNIVYPQFDFDMVSEAKTFYDLFWHYKLTDKEAIEFLSKSTLK